MDSVEKDFHIWKILETENTQAAYTISIGTRGICYRLPLDMALESLREELEGME